MGRLAPSAQAPEVQAKNVLSTAQNLLVITIHNYLCCTSVLCTSVKLSADLNCTETRLAAGPAWAAIALLAQTLCRYTVAGREGRGRNGLGAGREWKVCLRTLTTWHCPHSPAAGAAIDRYLLPAGPTAANLQQTVVHAWTDRQTDRRTDTVLFHRACCACYASSGKNIVGG